MAEPKITKMGTPLQSGMPHPEGFSPDSYKDVVREALRWSSQSRSSLAGLPERFHLPRGTGAVMAALEALVEDGEAESFEEGDNGMGQPITMFRLTAKGWGEEE
jgi:predicted ArsR family transcriptional regulator